jgi:hypothetical protein
LGLLSLERPNPDLCRAALADEIADLDAPIGPTGTRSESEDLPAGETARAGADENVCDGVLTRAKRQDASGDARV